MSFSGYQTIFSKKTFITTEYHFIYLIPDNNLVIILSKKDKKHYKLKWIIFGISNIMYSMKNVYYWISNNIIKLIFLKNYIFEKY